jgi:hypothetical protein
VRIEVSMRTTLILDDDVARAARHRAVEEGITLGEYVSRALRETLQASTPDAGGVRLLRYGDPARPTSHTPAQLSDLLASQEEAG